MRAIRFRIARRGTRPNGYLFVWYVNHRPPQHLAPDPAHTSPPRLFTHSPTHPPTEPDQVLHDVWSVIVTVLPEVFSVIVAPFEGMHAPPYRGESQIDPRDLCYDPRGWWRHAPALITNVPVPVGAGRLYRLARGLSTSGLPWGAGSLNEPLEEGEERGLSQIPRSCSSLGGGCETADDPSPQSYRGEEGG